MTTAKQYVPVFISSTFVDMQSYRAAAMKVLEDVKLAVNGMEIFGARPENSLETCLDEVAKSKFFIFLLGMRYGAVDQVSGKSYTHLEYEKANSMSAPILVYIVDKHEVRLLHNEFETDKTLIDKLEAFKKQAQSEHTTAYFSSPEDLAVKLKRDILREFGELGYKVDRGVVEPAEEKSAIEALLSDFEKVPAKVQGREVQLDIKLLGNAERVDEIRCQTLDLSPGATVKRKVKVLKPTGVKIDEIYAGWDTCDFLLRKPKDTDYTVIVKLLYAQERRLIKPEPDLGLPGPFDRWDPHYNRRRREYERIRPLENIEYIAAVELVQVTSELQKESADKPAQTPQTEAPQTEPEPVKESALTKVDSSNGGAKINQTQS